MAAGDLELLVRPEDYQGKITQLEGYVVSLGSLKDQFNALGGKASTVFGEDDASLNQARQIVNDSCQLLQQKIEATQATIDSLQGVLDSMNNASQAVSSALSDVEGMINALLS